MYKRQGNVGYEDGPEDEEYYFEGYDYDGESEEENGDESEGGGMSALEKALLAAELGMVGSKVHGLVKGRNNGSSVGDQSTMSMKAKGAINRAKGAGKKLFNRVGDKMRGMKKTLMKGKKFGEQGGQGIEAGEGSAEKRRAGVIQSC